MRNFDLFSIAPPRSDLPLFSIAPTHPKRIKVVNIRQINRPLAVFRQFRHIYTHHYFYQPQLNVQLRYVINHFIRIISYIYDSFLIFILEHFI